MKKRELQKNRMIKYFIDATAEIIEKEGIENVTIRKIADIAGYNSATIYNYFEEVSHLIFFASLRFLKDYINDLAVYIASGKDPIEKYLLGWECFCKHSLKEPKLFHSIFIADLGEKPGELIKHYYSLYTSDLINIPEELKPVLLEHNLSKRSKAILEKSFQEGFIKKENLEAINEMTILIWKGMLVTVLNNRHHYDAGEALKKTMAYIREITLHLSNIDLRYVTYEEKK